MKINIVIPGVGLSGGIRVLFRYAELLNQKGHDVIFYTPLIAYDVKNSNNELINKLHVISNSIKRINSYKVKHDQNHLEFNVKVVAVPIISNKYIRDADICMASAWPTAFSVAKLDLKKGKKVYFIQGYEIWNNEELGKKSYTLPLAHIVISSWIKGKLIKQLGENEVHVPIIYDGLDLDIFNNSERINVIDKTVEILMLYQNLAIKGVNDGLEVYKRIKEKYPNIKMTMFGLSERPNIPIEIQYYQNPSRDELKKLYSNANIFLYTSKEEGWGLTPLEAMASKSVVVGTNTGCMLDIGKNGINAMISHPGNVNEMVQNICYLLDNPSLFKNLSEEGFKDVQVFSWKNATVHLEKELEKILYENKN